MNRGIAKKKDPRRIVEQKNDRVIGLKSDGPNQSMPTSCLSSCKKKRRPSKKSD
jgi:hypothetical protein